MSRDTAHLPASPVCPQRVAGERTLAIPQTPTPTVRPLVRAIEAVVESVAQFAHVYAQLRAQAVVFVGLASRHLALRTCKTAKRATVTTQSKSSTQSCQPAPNHSSSHDCPGQKQPHLPTPGSALLRHPQLLPRGSSWTSTAFPFQSKQYCCRHSCSGGKARPLWGKPSLVHHSTQPAKEQSPKQPEWKGSPHPAPASPAKEMSTLQAPTASPWAPTGAGTCRASEAPPRHSRAPRFEPWEVTPTSPGSHSLPEHREHLGPGGAQTTPSTAGPRPPGAQSTPTDANRLCLKRRLCRQARRGPLRTGVTRYKET